MFALLQCQPKRQARLWIDRVRSGPGAGRNLSGERLQLLTYLLCRVDKVDAVPYLFVTAERWEQLSSSQWRALLYC